MGPFRALCYVEGMQLASGMLGCVDLNALEDLRVLGMVRVLRARMAPERALFEELPGSSK